MSEVDHNFGEGDYIIRTWPSGHQTMGVVDRWPNGQLRFEPLETYMQEGGVKAGNIYNFGFSEEDDEIHDRKATEKEVLMHQLS